ncbi:MAG: CARDB domain-containing protein, partial [archaeon]
MNQIIKSGLLNIMVLLLLVITGCPPADEAYSVAGEHYIAGFVLHNINDSTDTTLDYNPSELAIYNYSYDYPAFQPETYASVLFWLKPVHKYSGSMAAASWNEVDVPVNKVFYAYADSVDSDQYDSDWSLANYMKINYIIPEDDDEQFAYSASHEEHYESEYAYRGLNPALGEYREISFGSAPYIPTSFSINPWYAQLKHPLMRGKTGLSYLNRYSEISIYNMTSEEYDVFFTALPFYSVYLNGSLIRDGNITLRGGEWSHYALEHYLESNGDYRINITIPTNYPIYSMAKIDARFTKPSPEMEPPELVSLDVSPDFVDNLSVTVEMMDDSEISDFSLYYSTDIDPSWEPAETAGSGNFSANISAAGASAINIKFRAADIHENSVEYEISTVSLKARSITLNPEIENVHIVRGETLQLTGQCKDSDNNLVSGLRFEIFMNNQFAVADRCEFSNGYDGSVVGEEDPTGRLYADLFIPYNYSLDLLDVTTVFPGTGLYLPYRETVQLSVVTHPHDVAIAKLQLSDFKLKEPGTINTTIHNIGENTEENIQLQLIINNIIVDSITIDQLAAEDEVPISFNWTPVKANYYVIQAISVPVGGETYVGNNIRSNELNIGADLDLYVQIPYALLVNSSNTIEVEYWNEGNYRSENASLIVYSLSHYDYFEIEDEETKTLEFNGKTYEVSATISDIVEISVAHNNTIENHTLAEGQIVVLSDGTMMHFWNSGEDWIDLKLGIGKSATHKLDDLSPDDYQIIEYNLSFDSLGDYQIITYLNSSGDSDWQDNSETGYVRVIPLAADLDIHMVSPDSTLVNETVIIEVSVENQGFLDSSNVSLYIYDLPESVQDRVYYHTPESFTINGIEYTLTAESIDGESANLMIDTAANSAEFSVMEGNLIEHGELVILIMDIYENSIYYIIGAGSKIERDLEDLPAGADREYGINLTPNKIGRHTLISFVTASDDYDSENNHDWSSIYAKTFAPDLEAKLRLESSVLVNVTAKVEIELFNSGFRTATNITGNLYDFHKFRFNEFEFGSERDFYYDGTDYMIEPIRLNDTSVLLKLDGEENILTIGTPSTYSNGISIMIEHFDTRYVFLILGRFNETVYALPDLQPEEGYQKEISWTPGIEGDHQLFFAVNSPDDQNLENNMQSSYIRVMRDMADLEIGVDGIDRIKINDETEFEVEIENNGFRDAKNTSLEFYAFKAYRRFYAEFGITEQVYISDNEYNITVTRPSNQRFSVDVSGVDPFELHIGQAERLPGGFDLIITREYDNSVEWVMGNASHITAYLPDIEVDDSIGISDVLSAHDIQPKPAEVMDDGAIAHDVSLERIVENEAAELSMG